MNTFGNVARNIAIFRGYKMWDRRDLAAVLNVHPSVISRWEKGKRKPTYEMMVKMAEVFGIETQDLAHGEFELTLIK